MGWSQSRSPAARAVGRIVDGLGREIVESSWKCGNHCRMHQKI